MFVAAGTGVFVAAGTGVFVAAGIGVFVAAGAGVFVAAGTAVSVAAGGKVGVLIPLWKTAGDNKCPAETGRTAKTLKTRRAAIRITRGIVFMRRLPPSIDPHGGGCCQAASMTVTAFNTRLELATVHTLDTGCPARIPR